MCPDLLCNTPKTLFASAAGDKTSSETSSDDLEPPVQSKPAKVVKDKAGAKPKSRSRTAKHKVPNVNSQKPYDPTPASGTETGAETGGEGGAGAGDDCAMDDEALAQLQKQVKKLEAKVSLFCPVAHLQIPDCLLTVRSVVFRSTITNLPRGDSNS